MVIDLTGLPVANASLLDEATAAAEAMALIRARRAKRHGKAFFVDAGLPSAGDRRDPHARQLVRHRRDRRRRASDARSGSAVFGAHLQYPDTYGAHRRSVGD